MPLYRVQLPLRKGKRLVKKGELTRLDSLPRKVIERLVAIGAVSEVAPPPLNILPGWKAPAKDLEEIGVKSAVDFLEAHDEPLSRILKVSPKEVKKKKKEVEDWLIPKPEEPDERGG